MCAVPECDRPNRSGSAELCNMHYQRRLRTGDVHTVRVGKPRPLAEHHNWVGDDATYGAAHARVRTLRGLASGQTCAHCPAQAEHWAYDHTDPNPRFGRGLPFSLDPERYIPLCRSCHRHFDRSHR